MKNYFSILLLLFIIFSCSDEQINDSKIYNFESSIQQLSKLPLGIQRLESNNLTPDEKLNLWNQKFDILVKSIDDPDHRIFISNFQKKLTLELFETGLSGEEYENKWSYFIEKLQLKYNWTDDDVFVFFATFNLAKISKNQKNGGILEFEEITPRPGEELPDCNCRWGGLGCAGADCEESSRCPDDFDDEMGCGFLFLQTCTGSYA